jgi:hypothetical protein
MIPAIDKMKVCQPADMAELADALGSGPSGRKVVEVRVLLSAPFKFQQHTGKCAGFNSPALSAHVCHLCALRQE